MGQWITWHASPLLVALVFASGFGCSSDDDAKSQSGGAGGKDSSVGGSGGSTSGGGSGGTSAAGGSGGATGGTGAVTDGQADAPLDAGFDAGSPAFFDNFDGDAASPEAAWISKGITGGATLEFDTSVVVSAPRSLKIVTPIGNPDGGAHPYAILEQIIPLTKNPVFAQLKFRYETFTPTGVVDFVSLSAGPGAPLIPRVTIVRSATGWGVNVVTTSADGGTAESAFPFSQDPPAGQWLTLSLQVSFEAAGSVKCAVDGATVVDQTGLALQTEASPNVSLVIGASPAASPPSPSITVHYDDVGLYFP